jgi:pyrroloquinoline quinone (PQQ) biosynthesis protein C
MLATTEAEAHGSAMSCAQFRAELLGAIDGARAEDTRLHRLLMARRCPPELIRRYALATVRSADLFCATLAEMADKAPDAEARLVLLENLLEEEGMFLQPSQGMVHRPETSHPALARRFAAAVGAAGDGLEARHATGPGRAMLARGEWVEALAHLLIGQELLFCETAPAMARALEVSGLATRDVAFFWVHETADRKHGEQALELVLRHAHGRAQQQRCIEEASAGAREWLAAHGGLAA